MKVLSLLILPMLASAALTDVLAPIVDVFSSFSADNGETEKLSFQSHAHEEYLHPDADHVGNKVFGAFNSLFNPIISRVKREIVRSKAERHVAVDATVEAPGPTWAERTTKSLRSGWLRKHKPSLRAPHFPSIRYVRLKMRDNIELSTIVIDPRPEGSTEKRGVMFARSPYGPTSDQIADLFAVANGFIAVLQDQRGTFISDGEFTMWKNDADDGYDTLEWIKKQDFSNGKVYTAGISADGCGTFAMLMDPNEALKGQLLVWASADGHKTSYPGGAFREGLITGWMSIMAIMTQGDSFMKTLPDIVAHEALSKWWYNIEAPPHYSKVNWPTIHLSAWWDIFQGHQLEAFDGYVEHGKVKDHVLVVGPLGHCLLSPELFDSDLLEEDARGIVNAFGLTSEMFSDDEHPGDYFSKRMKKINLYVQGPKHYRWERNDRRHAHYWTSLDDWPVPRTTSYYLGEHSHLTSKVNEENNAVGYTYDAEHPQMTRGGNNLILTFTGSGCGQADQSKDERRKDVMVWTSQKLKEPIAIVGKITTTLFVSSDRNDTDFYVSLTDFYPDGRSVQVRYGIQRMRFRESTDTKTIIKPMEAGKIYEIEIDLWRTAYVFEKGHAVRVAVSSSSMPYYARNDNTGKAGDEWGDDPGVAHNKIHFGADYPSRVELPVVTFDQIPKNHHF